MAQLNLLCVLVAPPLGRQIRGCHAVGLDDDLLVEVLPPLAERDAALVEEEEEEEEAEREERGGDEVRGKVGLELLDLAAHPFLVSRSLVLSHSLYLYLYRYLYA